MTLSAACVLAGSPGVKSLDVLVLRAYAPNSTLRASAVNGLVSTGRGERRSK